MTTQRLSTVGREFVAKNGFGSAISMTAGLHLADSQWSITDITLGSLVNEPGNANYSRQSINVSVDRHPNDTSSVGSTLGLIASTIDRHWGFSNDAAFSFDLSDNSSSSEIDSVFLIKNFNSTVGGGSGDWVLGSFRFGGWRLIDDFVWRDGGVTMDQLDSVSISQDELKFEVPSGV